MTTILWQTQSFGDWARSCRCIWCRWLTSQNYTLSLCHKNPLRRLIKAHQSVSEHDTSSHTHQISTLHRHCISQLKSPWTWGMHSHYTSIRTLAECSLAFYSLFFLIANSFNFHTQPQCAVSYRYSAARNTVSLTIITFTNP